MLGKYKVVTLSMPEEIYKQANEIAKEGRTRSELFREALRQYVDAKKWRKLQRETAERARSLVITSEDDVKRIIRELRERTS
ncbi:MAG: ribbon-helix-helix domain-containing protein [Firmicutes bacterium]|nr:ribbon-helix-helix domain-containing protein [Bacillota bacterium]